MTVDYELVALCQEALANMPGYAVIDSWHVIGIAFGFGIVLWFGLWLGAKEGKKDGLKEVWQNGIEHTQKQYRNTYLKWKHGISD